MVRRSAEPSSNGLALLSPRELDVLEMTSRGLTNAEVADGLGVTVHAIKFHLASIYRRLGVANRTQAALIFAAAPASSVRKVIDGTET